MQLIKTANDLVDAIKTKFDLDGKKGPVDVIKYRYVIYARKSTDEEDKQVRSLQDQVDVCQEFARSEGLNVIEVIQESESAKEPDIRPKFREMMEGFKDGKYEGIIAWHPDRLSRNMKDAGEVIDLLDKFIIKDLKFKSFTFVNDTNGKMILGITFVISKQYSDKLSDDVSRGIERSILEGKYINKPKHGYFKDPNQYLRPDGNNFILIKQAFMMRHDGKSLEDIANFLLQNSYYRKNADGTKKYYKMDKQKVLKFMRDPIYTGVLMYGDTVVNLAELYDFTPMLTIDEFMRVNSLSSESQFFKLARSYRKNENIKANLMLGMVVCGDCGEPMSAGLTSKKTKEGVTKYFYYRCETDDCKRYGKSLRAKIITTYIYDYLDKKPFSSPESYNHYKDEMTRVSQERLGQARSALAEFQARKRGLEIRLTKVESNILSEDDVAIKNHFKEDLKKIKPEIDSIGLEITKCNKIIEKGKVTILTYEEFLELFEKMAKLGRSMTNMADLDFIIKKLFLNFTIKNKKVEKSTLNSPFASLADPKVALGAR